MLGVVPEDLGRALSSSYDELPKIIEGAAQHYATLPDMSFAVRLDKLMPDWRERIHIFVQASPAGAEPASDLTTHRRVFEKIKHRLVVLSQIDAYADTGSTDAVHGVAYPRTQAFLDDVIMHLDVMTKFARDLPYMLLNMDNHGML